MGDAARIIICGHAGTAGAELLRRRDIAVAWTLTASEARAVASVWAPNLVIVRAELASEVLATTWPAPVLVIDSAAGARADGVVGATVVADSGAGPILAQVGLLTGLRFAREPRVRVELPVRVDAGGGADDASSIDLSANGLSLRGWAPPALGAHVHISLGGPLEGLSAMAEVVRVFHHPDARCAGLRFLRLGPVEHARLADFVDDALEADAAARITIDLPLPVVEQTRQDATVALDALRDRLVDLHRAAHQDLALGRPRIHPGELAAASAEERRPAVNAVHTDTPTEPSAHRGALESSVAALSALTTGAVSAEIQADRARVRADLLRQIHADQPRTRAGTGMQGSAPVMLRATHVLSGRLSVTAVRR